MNSTIKRIVEIFDEIREKIPCDEEYDGKIYYANGNDGTDFDWNVNGRLPEFMMYHKNEMGYIKFMLNRDDTATAYVYPNGEMNPAETLVYKLPEGSALEAVVAMYTACDAKNKWDLPLDEIEFFPEEEGMHRRLLFDVDDDVDF